MTYSFDLRERVVEFVRSGGSKAEAARRFGIHRDTVYDWLSRKNLAPTPSGPRHRKIDKRALARHVQEHPDALLRERAALFKVSVPALSIALRKLGIRKKKSANI
jgi:excisionase family DNA binding protein